MQRNWRSLLRSLTNERGAWGAAQNGSLFQYVASPTPVYWKLDKTENFSRMRMKLKRNYNFKDHAGASRSHQDSQSTPISRKESEQVLSGIKLSAAITGGFLKNLYSPK